MPMQLSDYTFSGPCVSVVVNEKELESYHPIKCQRPNPFGAYTKIDDRNNQIMRLILNEQWGSTHIGNVAKFEFMLKNQADKNIIIAEPDDPLEINNKWSIWKWEIEYIEEGDSECDINKVPIMIDTIYWIKVNNKAVRHIQDIITMNDNEVLRLDVNKQQDILGSLLVELPNLGNRVETKWTWRTYY